MDLSKFSEELSRIAKIYHEQVIPAQNVLEAARKQQEWLQSINSNPEYNQLIQTCSENMKNFPPIAKEIHEQISREIELIREEALIRPLLEATAAFRAAPLWEQVKEVAEQGKELIGWYKPLSALWESVTCRLDSIKPSFGIAIETEQESVIPDVIIRDYSIEKKGESNVFDFPAPVIKDVVGLPNLFPDITYDEVIEFYRYLSKYPMIAIENITGRKIFNSINNIPCRELSEIDLFRGRLWKNGREMPFVDDEMFEPPFGEAPQGRFNAPGLSTLYFADSKDAVISELCKEEREDRFSIINARLIRPLRIIDLSKDTSPIIALCNKPVKNHSYNNTEYLIPNFLAQCCRFYRIDGFAYDNVIFPDSKNYAFINVFRDSFKILKTFDESCP